MNSAKEEVRKLLDTVPDGATFEDIQYHIYVRQKIAAGLADVEAGRVVDQEEAERIMGKWTGKSSGRK
jgi:predicted transcriptional regulator